MVIMVLDAQSAMRSTSPLVAARRDDAAAGAAEFEPCVSRHARVARILVPSRQASCRMSALPVWSDQIL
eukprot:3861730-Prymnesium_polylepis.1